MAGPGLHLVAQRVAAPPRLKILRYLFLVFCSLHWLLFHAMLMGVLGVIGVIRPYRLRRVIYKRVKEVLRVMKKSIF